MSRRYRTRPARRFRCLGSSESMRSSRLPLTGPLAVAAAAVLAAPLLHATIAGTASPAEPQSWPVAATASCPGSAQLTPERASTLLEQVRRLLAELSTTLAADPTDGPAAALQRDLQALGVPPARAGGWRQQAYDLADGLLAAASDPQAAALGAALAKAGFSPTPADMATAPPVSTGSAPTGPAPTTGAPVPGTGTPLTAPRSSSPPVQPLALHSALGPGAGGPLTIALRHIQRMTGVRGGDRPAQPAATSAAPAGDLGCPAPTPAPAAATTPTPPADPASSDTTTVLPPLPPSSAPPPTARGDSTSGAATSGGWLTDAQSLLTTLQHSGDPAAAALAQELAASGALHPASGPATTASGAPGAQSPAAAPPAGAPSGSSSDATGADPAGSGLPATGSASSDAGADVATDSAHPEPDNTDAAGGSAEDAAAATSSPVPGSPSTALPSTAAGGAGWEADARRLAGQLAAVAGSDPTAKALVDDLARIGVHAPDASTGPSVSSAPGSGSGAGSGSGSASGSSLASSPQPTGSRLSPTRPSGADTTGRSTGGASAARGSDTAIWKALAACESSGNWSTATGNGYYGGLQIDANTWRAYGALAFAPTAAQASTDQQIAVARKIRDARGGYASSWPTCSSKLGLK